MIITAYCMQDAKDAREAGGFCRSEFQKFTEYFARRLIQKAIAARYALPESSTEKLPHGQTFCEVVDTWRSQLAGAYECLRPYTTSVRNTEKGCWRTATNVPESAYKPTTGDGEWPFFVTLDRSTSHSFWITYKKKHLESPGIPLLQSLKVPPRGHDAHQIVEHAIGAMKGHVYKVLGQARARGEKLTTALVRQAIEEGCRLFTAASWAANLPRLWNCLRLIAAPKGQPMQITITLKSGRQRTSTQYGTGGGYCPPRCA